LKTIENFDNLETGIKAQTPKQNEDKEGPPIGYEAYDTPNGQVYVVDKEIVKAHSISTSKLSKEEQEKRKKILPCFWVPNLTPDAGNQRIEKPPNYTVCPEGHHVLRLKQVRPVVFTLAVTESSTKEEKERVSKAILSGRYMCSSCRKGLTNAGKAVCLSKCGHVVCQPCHQNLIEKHHQCVMCGEDCQPNQIILLQTGGTGFAAHGSKTVTSKVSPAFQC